MARERVRAGGSGQVRPGRAQARCLTLLSALAGPASAGAAPAELPPWEPAGAPVTGEQAPVTDEQAPAEAPVEVPAEVPARTAAEAPAPEGRPPGAHGSGATALPDGSAQLPPPPSDPNDAPFMAPPNNQIRGKPPRTRPDIRRGWSARRRFALTIAPAFASFRLQFQNRPAGARLHGAGFNVEFDAQVHRWIWLRAQGTYSGHRVDEVRVMTEEGDVVQTAPRGTIHATGFGVGPVFALDLGRFLPLIEVGLGGLRVASPAGDSKGQRGAACGDGGACDVGLKCSAANVCEPTIVPELFFGAAVDVLIRRNFSVGGQFRYYALLPAWSKFPVYLLGTVRVGVRF